MKDDLSYMRQAISMAKRVWGQSAPNPAVGCVLVKEGQVLAAAHTAPGGCPHAEARALEAAGKDARGATAYVTLEPCAHHGLTPPCAHALAQAGVARVVTACRDEDERVRGEGVNMLREAGIDVTEGVCEKEALSLYGGFFSRIHHGLPEINLKIATSLDGKICFPLAPDLFSVAPRSARPLPDTADRSRKGDTEQIQWITGQQARNYGHLLRAEHEAILTGIGTVLADDPELTCRLPGMEHRSPLRAVMDSNLRTPLHSKLVKTAGDVPLVLFTLEEAAEKHRPYLDHGAEIVVLEEMTLEQAARALATEGISRLLVEAGQGIASHALLSGLLARLYWFRAPLIIGEEGFSAFTGEALTHLGKGKYLSPESAISLGVDRMEVYAMATEGK